MDWRKRLKTSSKYDLCKTDTYLLAFIDVGYIMTIHLTLELPHQAIPSPSISNIHIGNQHVWGLIPYPTVTSLCQKAPGSTHKLF